MADLNPWLLATLGFLPALAVPLLACARGGVAQRLVGVQLLTTIGVLIIVTLTFVLTQPSSIDLALTFGFLGLPAMLLFAVVLERWV